MNVNLINQKNIRVGSGSSQTFQLNLKGDYEQVTVQWSDLKSEHQIIKSSALTCFNTEGVDCHGQEFKKNICVEGEKTLWFGISLDEVPLGCYTGVVDFYHHEEKVNSFELHVQVVSDAENEFERMFWLNSTIGHSDEVIKGYNNIRVIDNEVFTLGKKITLSDQGVLKSVETHDEIFYELLSDDIKQCVHVKGQKISCEKPWYLLEVRPDQCVYKRSFNHCDFSIIETLSVAFDGFVNYETEIKPEEEIDVQVTFEVPFKESAAQYKMGLDFDGTSYSPLDFKFNKKHQDSVWVGSHQVGMSLKFKDMHYQMPFSNVYYNNRPLSPSIWDTLTLTDKHVMHVESKNFKVGSGGYSWSVEMNITPVKKIDWKEHFSTRYYQPKENTDLLTCFEDVKKEKCNIINVHHGQEIYPFINYPFNHEETIRPFIDEAHDHQLGVKLYYTLRELSHHIDELNPFLSLDYEIFPKDVYEGETFWDARNKRMENNDGLDIGKHELWVKKNLDEHLIPAWEHRFTRGKYKGELCAAILTDTHSRLNNYFLEGLDWMVKTLDIDGIYIDDIAIDRKQMIRLRHVLDQKDDMLVDLHSWNHRNPFAGEISCMMLYMQHLSCFDSLWIGESYDYDKDPDYWFTEISGIPFGLTSQMLEGDGHPFRGLLYGMTNRSQWGKVSPKPLYDLWDDFGIESSQLIGYWERTMVQLNHKALRASVYVKEAQWLIVIASWCDEDVEVNLNEAIGSKNQYLKPQILGLQNEEVLDDKVVVPANKGVILLMNK